DGVYLPDDGYVRKLIETLREVGFPWDGVDLDWLLGEVRQGRRVEAVGIDASKIEAPRKSKKQLVNECIEKNEQWCGHELPKGLKKFWRSGKELGEDREWVSGPWHPLNGMSVEIFECDRFIDNAKVASEWVGRHGVVVFAGGEEGFHECLGINVERPGVPVGAVVYLDNEGDHPVTQVAKDFDEFMKMLSSCPLEDIDPYDEDVEDRLIYVDPDEAARVPVALPIPGRP
ncbi:hypothetical protein GSS88_06925, partial [Corynebacterium sp. 3HC-13]